MATQADVRRIALALPETEETEAVRLPTKFFTEPHYAGFPAVLVRPSEVPRRDLRLLLKDGWRCMAPPELTTNRSKR